MMSILNNEDITVLDRQIEQLTDFKPIPEHEVKILCEKVILKKLNIISCLLRETRDITQSALYENHNVDPYSFV